MTKGRPLRVLTWHIHGSYLNYLSNVPVTWYLPVNEDRSEGYGGRWTSWPDNVREVAAEEVAALEVDCVLFQSRRNWELDRHEILSEAQRRLPSIYLEHDPPQLHPTDTRHPFDDPRGLLVHVTAFNGLMWDNGQTPTVIIEHGVTIPDGIRYSGELERGIVVVNNIARRGRRLGYDVYQQVRESIPLDLVGISWQDADGIAEVKLPDLPAFEARYRFFFNPIRYTSLGLAVCEAMAVGLPIVGFATTEMATVIQNGVSGYVETRLDRLIEHMHRLVADPAEARALGDGARTVALERFNIDRFVRDWLVVLEEVTGR